MASTNKDTRYFVQHWNKGFPQDEFVPFNPRGYVIFEPISALTRITSFSRNEHFTLAPTVQLTHYAEITDSGGVFIGCDLQTHKRDLVLLLDNGALTVTGKLGKVTYDKHPITQVDTAALQALCEAVYKKGRIGNKQQEQLLQFQEHAIQELSAMSAQKPEPKKEAPPIHTDTKTPRPHHDGTFVLPGQKIAQEMTFPGLKEIGAALSQIKLPAISFSNEDAIQSPVTPAPPQPKDAQTVLTSNPS